MTFGELINKVLRALREDTITTSFAEAYPSLVAQVINEVKEDIEDLGAWYALRTTVNSSTVAATASLDLTASTTERSYLLHTQNRAMAFVVEAGNETQLTLIDKPALDAMVALAGSNVSNALPQFVAFARGTTGLTAYFWPIPDDAYDVRFVFVVPQEDMTATTDTITIPGAPVWREALVRCMEERGEEFSGSLEAARSRAGRAVEAAMLRDFGAEQMTVEVV